MALLDPHRPDQHRSADKLHPCIGLIAGFGVITLGATAIHIVFNLLV
jgi:hypothetical protein